VFECWATWCPPCIALIPHVNELHKKYHDKGLRVHGMSWENETEKVKKFVKGRGEGMSYPIGIAVEGSPFEKEFLTAAGVESIPHAFVVKDGKLLFGTDASRLTDSLIEMTLSGDEGAKKAAAIIQAAYDNRGKVEALYEQYRSAKSVDDKEAKLKELETLDSGYYQIPEMKLYITNIVRKVERSGAGGYSPELIKAVATKYTEYVEDGGDRIGPNHFVYLTSIQGMAGDKEAALKYANKGVEVAKNFARASEARTSAFMRFAESVKEGTIPKMAEVSKWHREAKEKAKAAQ